MKYIKPNYSREFVETQDIMSISLGNNVSLTETADGNAQVSSSVLDVLGLR